MPYQTHRHHADSRKNKSYKDASFELHSDFEFIKEDRLKQDERMPDLSFQ